MNGPLALPLGLFVIATASALFGLEQRRAWLVAAGKPSATLALLAIAWVPLSDQFGTLVCAGLFLSFLGDVVLLRDSRSSFLTGLTLFLFAHLLYAVAFFTSGGLGDTWWTPLVGLGVFGAATLWLMRRLWPGVDSGLRVPLVFYAAGITAMAVSAYSTLAGPWSPFISGAAAMGAMLFYLSDANLAWNRFVNRSEHGQTITLSLYWTGQLGIAVAARWAQGGI